MSGGESPPLTPLEVVSAVVIGEDPGAVAVPAAEPNVDPLAALEDAIRPALARPPCLVEFSGGRDSSVVLAVAAHLSRREGLELPVPVTLRFPNAPDADESEWQNRVVRSLDLQEWRRYAVCDELDILGPAARSVLLTHGLLWPPNSHSAAPYLADARDCTILTGLEGDGLFDQGLRRWGRAAHVLNRGRLPGPRDLLRVGLAYSPSPVRRLRERKCTKLGLTWLKPAAQRAVERAWVAEVVAEPVEWSRRVRWWARRRYLAQQVQSYGRVAGAAGVRLLHPLLDPRFLAAVGLRGGRAGFGSRTDAMRALFTGLLPDRVISRTDKASFDDVYWGPHSRRFLREWDEFGVPRDLVDVKELRCVWSQDTPPFRTALLAQAAWLARELGSFESALAHQRPVP